MVMLFISGWHHIKSDKINETDCLVSLQTYRLPRLEKYCSQLTVGQNCFGSGSTYNDRVSSSL